jgi:hypothetical protein
MPSDGLRGADPSRPTSFLLVLEHPGKLLPNSLDVQQDILRRPSLDRRDFVVVLAFEHVEDKGPALFAREVAEVR